MDGIFYWLLLLVFLQDTLLAGEPVKYLSIRYTKHLKRANIAASVGSTGDFYDHAMVETINAAEFGMAYYQQRNKKVC